MRDDRATEDQRNDAGVIAIVVALSVSTFLLGFAALAVDLGSAYARKAEVQSVADRLALAGARGLPETQLPGGAMDLITKALTQICKDKEKLPGICPDDPDAPPNLNWALDNNPGNGQITFYTDPDGDAKYALADRVTNLATPSTAVRVELPPSRVEFGLAGAIGFDSADLQESSTARIGTPIGAGILPIALTQADLDAGQFCLRTGGGPTGPTLPGPVLPDPVVPSADPCQLPQALTRGAIRLARPEPGSRLARNIRSSPKVNLYPAGGLLGDLGATAALRCASQTFTAASTCVSTTTTRGLAQSLASGLLKPSGNTPGRLTRQCGAGTTPFDGIAVDASDLFDGSLLTAAHGSGDLLKRRLTGQLGPTVAGAGDRGWISSQALRCGRLAVLPVLGDLIPGIANAHRITGFSYVWIDDDSATRGLTGDQNAITAVRGYVVDPGFLPAVVAGSPLVGPYLGGDMPTEALLIHDLGGSAE